MVSGTGGVPAEVAHLHPSSPGSNFFFGPPKNVIAIQGVRGEGSKTIMQIYYKDIIMALLVTFRSIGCQIWVRPVLS